MSKSVPGFVPDSPRTMPLLTVMSPVNNAAFRKSQYCALVVSYLLSWPVKPGLVTHAMGMAAGSTPSEITRVTSVPGHWRVPAGGV